MAESSRFMGRERERKTSAKMAFFFFFEEKKRLKGKGGKKPWDDESKRERGKEGRLFLGKSKGGGGGSLFFAKWDGRRWKEGDGKRRLLAVVDSGREKRRLSRANEASLSRYGGHRRFFGRTDAV